MNVLGDRVVDAVSRLADEANATERNPSFRCLTGLWTVSDRNLSRDTPSSILL